MDTSLIRDTYLDSSIILKGDYQYFLNPISDGNPRITKELLEQITDCIIEISDLDCDVILVPEAMAIQYGAALTMRTGIPFQIIRKTGTGLPDEISFSKKTGYGESKMYLHGLGPGTRVCLVDDVLSTGGTLRSMVKALREKDIIISEAIMILNKSTSVDSLSKDLNIPIRTILDVGVEDGRPIIR